MLRIIKTKYSIPALLVMVMVCGFLTHSYALVNETNTTQTYVPMAPVYGYSNFYYNYSSVLSPPLDVLPAGFTTITMGDATFFYEDGVFYQKNIKDQKYVIVPPPIGAVVYTMPTGYQMMVVQGIGYYEYKGVFYKRILDGYKVVEPPASAI